MKHVIILITLMVLVLVLKAKNDKDFRKYLKFVLIKIPLSFIFKYDEDPMDEFRKFMIDRMSQRTHRIYIITSFLFMEFFLT